MRPRVIGTGLLAAVIVLAGLLVAASPVIGMPPLFQPAETERAQTIEAFVNEGLQQTQTAVMADLYATADALYAPSDTPTPAQGRDARVRFQAMEFLAEGCEYYYREQYTYAAEVFGQVIEL